MPIPTMVVGLEPLFATHFNKNKFPHKGDEIPFHIFDYCLYLSQYDSKHNNNYFIACVDNFTRQCRMLSDTNMYWYAVNIKLESIDDIHPETYGLDRIGNYPFLMIFGYGYIGIYDSCYQLIVSIPNACCYIREIIRIYLEKYPKDANKFVDIYKQLAYMETYPEKWIKEASNASLE